MIIDTPRKVANAARLASHAYAAWQRPGPCEPGAAPRRGRTRRKVGDAERRRQQRPPPPSTRLGPRSTSIACANRGFSSSSILSSALVLQQRPPPPSTRHGSCGPRATPPPPPPPRRRASVEARLAPLLRQGDQRVRHRGARAGAVAQRQRGRGGDQRWKRVFFAKERICGGGPDQDPLEGAGTRARLRRGGREARRTGDTQGRDARRARGPPRTLA